MPRRHTILWKRSAINITAFAVVCVPLAGYWLVNVYNPDLARTAFITVTFAMLFLGGSCAWLVWSQVSARRLRSKLAANNRRHCLYCFFDLRSLGKVGTCPECGEPFEIWKVQHEWREGIAKELDVG